jgi:methyl-accepting chemotaxis protein WspA
MFKNLKISVKLLLSTVVFVFPIGVLLYFVIYVFDKDISNAKNEKIGNIALGGLVSVTNDVIEFHNLSLLKRSDPSVFEKYYGNTFIDNIASSIDSGFSQTLINCKVYDTKIKSISINDSKFLNKSFEPQKLFDIWKKIHSEYSRNNAINDSSYKTFYDGSQTLARFIADESGLILDPDLDSYYLMDISALVLPKLQIHIGEILTIIQRSYSEGIITEYDANKVRIIIDMIELDYLDRINQGILTSLREDKNFYDESETLRNNLMNSNENFRANIQSLSIVLRKWYSGDISDESQLLTEIKRDGYNALNTSIKFWKVVNNELDILLDKRIEYYVGLRAFALISSGIAFTLAAIMVLFVAKQISRHLGIVTDIAVEIAEGNIDKAVMELSSEKSLGVFSKYSDDNIVVNDEILKLYKSIRKMTYNLSSLLLQVSKSGNQVSDTTFKITTSAHDIEATVAEQAALTNQVNATSNEISKTSAELAKTMDFLTMTFHDNANMLSGGLEKLNDIKVNMNDLLNASGEISQKLDLIKERASSINSVITTITKVANQTNLVSLNASIEAERAGAFGTGFAVVAREIRRLADQTAVAALNIEEMINEMQVAVRQGGESIVRYMDKTKNGTEKTNQIIDSFSVLIERTNELPDKIFVANMSMKQQSESASQIHESMQQLNTAAIQTRNTIIEFNAATEKLNDAVKGLTDELKKFSLKSLT